MNKKKLFVRIIAVMMALLLMIPTNMDVQAAKGTVKSVSVTNLPAKTLTLKKGKTFTLKTKVEKTGSVSTAVKFKSSNTKVATVNSKGKITAKKNGTAKITVTSKANSKKKVTITVTVGKPVTKVKLNKTKATVNVGKTVTLKATVTPTKASNKKVVWTSSNTKVAKVNSKGKVTAIKAGTAKITATAADGSGKKKTCTITVTNKVTKVTLDKKSMNVLVGEAFALKATVTPAKADNTELKWTSSNDSVAVVDGNGKVTAVRAGTAKITATAKDGSKKSASCTVTVNAPTDIAEASIEDGRTIKIKLTAADKVTMDNLKVKTWKYRNTENAKELLIDSVTTTDNINYVIKLNQKHVLRENQSIEVSVTDLRGTEKASVEVIYKTDARNYVYNVSCTVKVNEAIDIEFDEYNSVGYQSNFSIKNLPEGIKYYTNYYDYYTVTFYGTPTKIGRTTTVYSFVDELGDAYTYNIKWNVYDGNGITANISDAKVALDSSGGTVAYVSRSISVYGGSGSYTYAIEGEDHGLGIRTYSDGSAYVYGYLYEVGTYNVKIRVTDAADETKTTVIDFKIEVVGTGCVTGTVTDSLGNPIPNAYIYFSDTDENANPGYGYAYTDNNGVYTVYVESGKYDITVRYNGTYEYVYNQSLADNTTYNYKFEDLYKVTINTNGLLTTSDIWYDENDYAYDYYGRQYGYGETLFLPAGSYKLHAEAGEILYLYNIEADFSVSAKENVVTPKISKRERNVSALSLDTPISVTTNKLGVVYKFTPSTSGTYYFYSTGSYDTYGYLYDANGSQLTYNDDAGAGSNFLISYSCTANTTYYIKARSYFSSLINFKLAVSATKPTT